MKKRILVILAIVSSVFVGLLAGMKLMVNILGKEINRINQLSDKRSSLFLMMNQWVKVKQDGKNLADYFKKLGYQKIAIYGMNYAGETLLKELKSGNINVVYGIDKGKNGIHSDIDIVSPDENLEKVDVIVVTAITFYDEIVEMLSAKIECPIISLEDILYEV